ncbi:MAG: tectonin domain-containing protein, partial [Candidatus Brocadiia bacterium]
MKVNGVQVCVEYAGDRAAGRSEPNRKAPGRGNGGRQLSCRKAMRVAVVLLAMSAWLASGFARGADTSRWPAGPDEDADAQLQDSTGDVLADAPPPPTGVSATDGEYADRVRITWSPAPGADLYQVYRADKYGDPGSVVSVGNWTSDLYFDDTTGAPEVAYYYMVKSRNISGSSDLSLWNTGWRRDDSLVPQDVPYEQDFSAGLPSNLGGWHYFSDADGRIRVDSGRLLMDDTTDDTTYSLNEAVLHLDLEGHSNVKVRVSHTSFADEDHAASEKFIAHSNGDAICVSPHGTYWYRVTNLTGDFTDQVFDLDPVVEAAEISYTSNFRIKFQQYDNYAAPMDGRAFDDILVTSSPPFEALVCGLNASDGIFRRQGVTPDAPAGTDWDRIPGRLTQASAGVGSLWGLNETGGIWCRTGISSDTPSGTGWSQVTGTLAQISAGGPGVVWGLNGAGGIFVREGITEGEPVGTGWSRVPGKLAYISVGVGSVWGLNEAGGIFVRTGVSPDTPEGTAWERVPGTLAQVAVGDTGLVWGLNSAGGIFVRTGVTADEPAGTGWDRVAGRLSQVTAGFDVVWGLNENGGIFAREGVTADTPEGSDWSRVAGTLAQVTAGLLEPQTTSLEVKDTADGDSKTLTESTLSTSPSRDA